jgi:hypothetical protein
MQGIVHDPNLCRTALTVSLTLMRSDVVSVGLFGNVLAVPSLLTSRRLLTARKLPGSSRPDVAETDGTFRCQPPDLPLLAGGLHTVTNHCRQTCTPLSSEIFSCQTPHLRRLLRNPLATSTGNPAPQARSSISRLRCTRAPSDPEIFLVSDPAACMSVSNVCGQALTHRWFFSIFFLCIGLPPLEDFAAPPCLTALRYAYSNVEPLASNDWGGQVNGGLVTASQTRVVD